MSYVFHRGEFIAANQANITPDNRGFRFGDGFFETMRGMSGKVLFLSTHFKRIIDTASALKMQLPESFSEAQLRHQVQGLLQRNQHLAGARIRITFFRKSAGFYRPDHDDMAYMIESQNLPEEAFTLNDKGKIIDIYQDFKKDLNKLSQFKTLNSQLYVMAAIHARDKGWDDALIQNAKFAIIEACASNLFIVSNGVLYTPTLEDGPIAGTMRMNIINLAIDHKIKVYECTINPHNMLSADEVFLTNAVRGVEWVVGYRTKRYYNDMARRMTGLLNDLAQQDVASLNL
ncbi:MAG: aminotransferase class IV [Flavobacteriales bacterium]